ncbi:MAG: family 10 glycosylhydrolase, partial [Nannocystaceae bacterium]|nr:family 10 glycosylhydrolase [Nannocystaceae bacterium]
MVSLRVGNTALVDLSEGVSAANHPAGAGQYGVWYDATNDAFGTASSTVVGGEPALRIDDGGYTNGVYTVLPEAIEADGTYLVEVTMQVVESEGAAFDRVDAYQVGVSHGGAAIHRGLNPSDLTPADAVGHYAGLTDGDDTGAGFQVVSTSSFEAAAGDDVRIAFGTDVLSGDWALNAGGWVGAYVVVTSIELVSLDVEDPAFVVDNDDGNPAFSESGGWIPSGGVGYDGGTYLYTSSGNEAVASWAVDVPAGYYDVQTIYTSGGNRAHSALYSVAVDGAVVATRTVDQRYGNLAWRDLGLIEVEADGEVVVTLDAAASSPAGTVTIADAVRLVPSDGPPPVDEPEMRIAAITVFDDVDDVGAIQATVDALEGLHYNAIAVHTRYRGDATYFPNRVDTTYPNSEPRSAQAGDVDVLAEYVSRGHASGMQIFAYINTHLVTDGADSVEAETHVVNVHPQWRTWAYNAGVPTVQTTAEDGEGLWLDPALPEVRGYLADIAGDVALNYEIDGIILDRIRYPQTSFTRTNADFGYHPDAIAAFNLEYEKVGIPDPYDPDWIEFRQLAITGTVGAIYDRMGEIDKSLKLLAYPIGRFNDAISFNYQNWPQWLRDRHIDAVLPQIYTSDSAQFASRVSTHAAAYDGDRLVGVTTNTYSAGMPVADQIEAVRAAGLDGTSPFRHGTMGALGYFEELELAWDGTALFPEMPWKGVKIKRLRLRKACSSDPDVYRSWRVYNPNPWAIEVTAWVLGTAETQTFFAPPGDSLFETPAQESLNVAKMSWFDHYESLRTDA